MGVSIYTEELVRTLIIPARLETTPSNSLEDEQPRRHDLRDTTCLKIDSLNDDLRDLTCLNVPEALILLQRGTESKIAELPHINIRRSIPPDTYIHTCYAGTILKILAGLLAALTHLSALSGLQLLMRIEPPSWMEQG